MEPLSSFLRRLKAENYDLAPEAKSQTLQPHCSHWLNYKVHRNSWEETDKVQLSQDQRGPCVNHLVTFWVLSLSRVMEWHWATPLPVGCPPAFLQKFFPASGSHLPWDCLPRDISISTKALKGRIVVHASSNQKHLARRLARGGHSKAGCINKRWTDGWVEDP